ncbi:MAG: thiamine pyrophosphate-dependent enzyme, partial [Bacteroidales bacterium]
FTKVDVPFEWNNIAASKFVPESFGRLAHEWVKTVADVVNAQCGNDLPVSTFKDAADGVIPSGTAAYEKRGIATHVPSWIPENCIQCNQCSFVCPHAAIRPFLMTEEEAAKAPASVKRVKGNGPLKDYFFTMQVDPADCTGCGNCADVCPAKTKALVLESVASQEKEQANFDYMHAHVGYKDTVLPKEQNVKNSQFSQPLFEFSGACSGCGETPYIKAITQLFGDRMVIANATGCTSIYSGSFPSSPYCKDKNGRGPAWSNSLFEDNAEYGLGMKVATNRLRETLQRLMVEGMECNTCTAEMKVLFAEWLSNKDDAKITREISDKLVPMIEACSCNTCKELVKYKDLLVPRSQWIFGGDGWAYDIGYGGLDHVLASGENVNVLVVDTEVYSNTGGQSSKSTPAGAVAKFATSGKKIRKKDLGMMAMSYGYVYVAQVAMGANQAQFLNALKEAEAYDGPSIIIAYAPCINHGLKAGMGKSQREEKMAVECGYWHLYRFNPTLDVAGKNPFSLDSKEPDWTKFQDFSKGEV